MSFIKTYDIVEMVLDEAIDQSHDNLVISNEMESRLKASSEIIDRLSQEFDGESIEAEVNEEGNSLVVTMVCPDMVWEHGRSHEFFQLIQLADGFRFSAKDGSLMTEFAFANIFSFR